MGTGFIVVGIPEMKPPLQQGRKLTVGLRPLQLYLGLLFEYLRSAFQAILLQIVVNAGIQQVNALLLNACHGFVIHEAK